MRMQTVLLGVIAALILAIICVATPQLEVTLNEPGTEVLSVSLFKPASPAMAKAAE